MAINDIRKNRLDKLKNISNKGINPYPGKAKRTHRIKDVLSDFNDIKKSEEQLIVDGRIRSFRHHGKSAFLDIEDGTGKIQIYLKEDRLGELAYKFFLDNFDVGDFVEIRGTLFKTKRGEKTIEVDDFKILAKSLRPLPEKWHGLKDIEERYRKRYLDLIFNPEVKEKFILRTKIIKAIRKFLDNNGFLEVETPILQPIYGGATARPFKTYINALDTSLYLRIAPELYLKRLLVGGFERVYEIGKCFRNEGVDRQHNPDFTMLEFYYSYIDYKGLMKFAERLFSNLLKEVIGTLKIEYEGKEIDFKTPWPRIEFTQLLRKYTGISFEDVDVNAMKKKAGDLGVKISPAAGKPEIADEIYKKYCRPKIWNPVFLIHYPSEFKPLAKSVDRDSSKSANFQIVVAGWELANAYSELNDPTRQKKEFKKQENLFKAGLEEAHRVDEDYIEALEYGMPPAAGFGMGIDRLVALLTNSHSLREVILFPTMKLKP